MPVAVEGKLRVGIACGVGQASPGYPPHAEYGFALGPQPGLVVLSQGPRPVYYSRTVTTSFQYPVSEASAGGPTDDDRLEYLRAMSPVAAGDPFRAHTVEIVTWSTAGELSERVRELRSRVERRFGTLVDRARRSRSVLSGVSVQPSIDLHMVDHRTDKTVPLPAFAR